MAGEGKIHTNTVDTHVKTNHTWCRENKRTKYVSHSQTAAHGHRLSRFRPSGNLERQEQTQILQLSELPFRIEVTPEPKSHGSLKEGMAEATQVPPGGRSRTFGTSRTGHFNLGEQLTLSTEYDAGCASDPFWLCMEERQIAYSCPKSNHTSSVVQCVD